MTFKKLMISASVVTLLAGATAPAHADTLGTLLGAAGGAAVGSNIGKGKGNIAAIAVGTLLGAGIGDSISDGRLSRTEERTTVVTYDDYPSYGRGGRHHNRGHHGRGYQKPYYTQSYTNYWVNPQPNIVEVNNYQPMRYNDDEYCREFIQNVTIGGRTQQSYGTACRQEDGSWEVQR
jgi:surface antigen